MDHHPSADWITIRALTSHRTKWSKQKPDGGRGALQFAMATWLPLLRRIITPVVSGTVIMLIAIVVFPVAFDRMEEIPEGAPLVAAPVIALATLAVAGVDAGTGLVHSLSTTAANVADVTEAHRLLHGGETQALGDAGYQGVEKRPEQASRAVQWRVAMRPGLRRQLAPGSEEARAQRRLASTRGEGGAPVSLREAALRIREGALSGVGEEPPTSRAAAGLRQPATSCASPRVIVGAVRPLSLSPPVLGQERGGIAPQSAVLSPLIADQHADRREPARYPTCADHP